MSNAQGVAFLSFGLIVSGGGGAYPSVYDVRSGVDNGEGNTGTLTSPAAGNVVAGVQYGGGGNQYTGTFACPSSSSSSGSVSTITGNSYYNARLAEFYAFLKDEEYGTEIARNNLTKPCIKTPEAIALNMTPGPYVEEMAATFDILRADWLTLKLGDKDAFECTGNTWQVVSHRDDLKEPTVQFYAKKKV